MKTDNRIMVFVFDEKGCVTHTDVTYHGDSTVYAFRASERQQIGGEAQPIVERALEV